MDEQIVVDEEEGAAVEPATSAITSSTGRRRYFGLIVETEQKLQR